MKPISNEKRELLIAAKRRGEKESDIAVWLSISKRSVNTIWSLYRKRGDFLPIPYKGRSSIISDAKIDEICRTIENSPDITLNELIENLSLPIKKSQLSKLLIKVGLSYKKRLFIRKVNLGKTFKRNVQSGIKVKKN